VTTTTEYVSSLVFDRELFISNEWRPASTGEYITVVDPATEQPVGKAAAASKEDIDAAVAAARDAFDNGPWPAMTIQERAAALVRFAEEMEKDTEAITEVTVQESGLTVGACRGGAKTLPGVMRYYASLAASFPLLEIRKGLSGVTARIEKRPIGVVAAIIPWNSPLGMTAFKLPQALLTGNTVIMKPSEDTPISAGYVGDAWLRAGLPTGVLNIVTALPEASQYLVSHPGVDKITFTGSTAVGRAIAAAAAPTLKQLTLELGGKSPAVVLDDASVERVVETMVPAMTNNNGEVCTMPSRLIVPESRKDEIVDAMVSALREVSVGDPADPKTEVGPMVSRKHYERVMGYLQSAVDEGGKFAIGGGRPEGLDTGYYVAPTIITDVGPDAKVAQEEIFGPVLTVLTYHDEDEALRIANDVEFGLSGAVYSTDQDRALEMARKIRSGTVSLNNGLTMDIGVPFGGVKQSGYGRELGPEGLEAYLETRTIFIDGEPVRTLD
jgi:aldehyde dehydrogenase (NAD+)